MRQLDQPAPGASRDGTALSGHASTPSPHFHHAGVHRVSAAARRTRPGTSSAGYEASGQPVKSIPQYVPQDASPGHMGSLVWVTVYEDVFTLPDVQMAGPSTQENFRPFAS